MHYYQWKIGDYRRDTAHLSHLEHGIYRTLIDTYMLNEAPLTGDIQELERKHNIKTKNEKQALLSVLNDFFKFENETFLHCRCDENISSFREKSKKASNSAKIRWDNDANAMRTQCNEDANHKPLTINHKEEGDKPPRATVDKFKKPTAKEVSDYCQEIQSPISPQGFIDFYDSNGWKVGMNSMESWEASVRTWTQREKKNGKAQTTGKPSENQIERMAKTLNITPKAGENYDSLYRRCLSQVRE